MTGLLIILGGVVCVTQSGAGCPDWPGCFGRVIPPLNANAIIEFAHRLVAALTTPFILATAWVGWRKSRQEQWISLPPVIAFPFLVAVIIFGAIAVLRGLPPALAVLDLGSALIVLALMLTPATVAFARQRQPNLADHFNPRNAFTRLVMAALAVTYVALVSGVLVAGNGSLTSCLGWPLYSPRLFMIDLHGWLAILRLALSFIGALLVVAIVLQAWRTQRQKKLVLHVASWTGGVFLAEILAAGLLLAGGYNIFLLVFYTTAAVIFWCFLVALTVLTGLLPN